MVLDVQHILAFNFFPTPRETIDNPETMVSGLSTVSGGGVVRELNAKMCYTSRATMTP